MRLEARYKSAVLCCCIDRGKRKKQNAVLGFAIAAVVITLKGLKVRGT